jgi:hypothetical protein
MKPLTTGGFGPRKHELNVIGYLARNKGGNAGIEDDDNFTANQKSLLYCYDTKLSCSFKQGMYIEDSGELYKCVHDDNYVLEGGFVVHTLQLVTGPTDEQVENPHVGTIIQNDY